MLTHVTTPTYNLTPEPVAIDSLVHHPRNPRRGNVARIQKSLATNGQFMPILVQASTRYVVKGNHTLKAAKAEGWTTIDAIVADMDDDTALRILLDDNHASDGGEYDKQELADLLNELAAAGQLGSTTYTESDLDKLMASLSDGTDGKDRDAAPALGEVSYSLVVTCTDETHQGELLSELLERGLDARPVML